MKSRVLAFSGAEYMLRLGPKGEPVRVVSPSVAQLDVLELVAKSARKILRLSLLTYLVLE